MKTMTFHLCDYCARTERMEKLLAIVRAAKGFYKDVDELERETLGDAIKEWDSYTANENIHTD